MSQPPVQLSRLILGTMGYGPIRARQRIDVIHCAIDHGLTSIDTAPLYGYGEVEEIVGRAIRDRRNQVQLLGKCGLRWDSNHGAVMFADVVDGETREVRKDSRPDALQRDIEASLRRLRIEAFDLMQIHEHDLSTPLEDALDCLVRLQAQGKIRAIGVSNFSLDALAAAFRLLPENLWSTQNMFNLLEQAASASVRQFAAQNKLRFLGYSPFAQGVLAGKLLNSNEMVNDWRSGSPAFHAANAARVNAVITRIALPVTQEYDITLPQLILAATLSRTGVSHVIAGAATTDQVRSNAAALAARIPDAALDSLAQALGRCGWSRLAGQAWPVRLRAMARKFRRVARF